MSHYSRTSIDLLVMPLLLAAMVLAASGCNGGPGSPAAQVMSAPGAVASTGYGMIDARFVPGRDRSLIQVSSRGRDAITSAVLVMPDGSRIPAETIDSQADPAVSGPGEVDGLENPNFVLRNPTVPQPVQGFPQATTVAIGQTLSSAEIRLTNIPVYGRDWRRARIEVIQGEGAGAGHSEIPAPEPIP